MRAPLYTGRDDAIRIERGRRLIAERRARERRRARRAPSTRHLRILHAAETVRRAVERSS